MSSKDSFSNFAIRLGLITASHPLEYAKVLVQIGFEPLPPYRCKTLFGKSALCLPNGFLIVKHIKSVDGFIGCYRGLIPKFCVNLISGLTFQWTSNLVYFENKFNKPVPRRLNSDDNAEHILSDSVTDDIILSEAERRTAFLQDLKRDLVSRSAAVVASHPFQVISVRIMAQFVGGESRYEGIIGSIMEVYKTNGIAGFFSGLVPRMIGELFSLFLASTLVYLVNSYLVKDQELQKYSDALMNYFASAVTYPFTLVSTCMIVSTSGLVAGRPPNMPLYTSWMNCWRHLSETNQLKRGSTLFWRYYFGPEIIYKNKRISSSVFLNSDL